MAFSVLHPFICPKCVQTISGIFIVIRKYLFSAILDLRSGTLETFCSGIISTVLSIYGYLVYYMSVFIQAPACIKCRRIYFLLHGNVAAAAELISEGCGLTIRQYKGSIFSNYAGICTVGIAQRIDCALWLLQFSGCSRTIIRNGF